MAPGIVLDPSSLATTGSGVPFIPFGRLPPGFETAGGGALRGGMICDTNDQGWDTGWSSGSGSHAAFSGTKPDAALLRLEERGSGSSSSTAHNTNASFRQRQGAGTCTIAGLPCGPAPPKTPNAPVVTCQDQSGPNGHRRFVRAASDLVSVRCGSLRSSRRESESMQQYTTGMMLRRAASMQQGVSPAQLALAAHCQQRTLAHLLSDTDLQNLQKQQNACAGTDGNVQHQHGTGSASKQASLPPHARLQQPQQIQQQWLRRMPSATRRGSVVRGGFRFSGRQASSVPTVQQARQDA